MDKRNKISFIPRKPISRKTQTTHRPMSLKIVSAFIIFLITIVSYGGMFFYKDNLAKSFKNEQLKLSSAKQKLDPNNTIETAQEFQKRTTEIKKLLDSHVAPSVVFNLLQSITLKSIKFTSFQFSAKSLKNSQQAQQKNKEANKKLKKQVPQTAFLVTLKGVAPTYSSVAYQSDVIKKEISSKNDRIKSFVISDVSLGEGGNVLFDLKLELNPSFLAYRNVIVQDKTPGVDSPVFAPSPATLEQSVSSIPVESNSIFKNSK